MKKYKFITVLLLALMLGSCSSKNNDYKNGMNQADLAGVDTTDDGKIGDEQTDTIINGNAADVDGAFQGASIRTKGVDEVRTALPTATGENQR